MAACCEIGLLQFENQDLSERVDLICPQRFAR